MSQSPRELVERLQKMRQSRFLVRGLSNEAIELLAHGSFFVILMTGSVVQVMEGMNQRYEFPQHKETSGSTDANLTIEDMATKSEILNKLQCNLLPEIKEQITSLLKSLNDLDEEYPRPDVDLTLSILSDLDQILQATVSSILTIADEAPLPDKKHDHRLGKLKSFRCSQLRSQIKSIVGSVAEHLLECYGTFMKCCTMAILVADPSLAWQEASKSKQSIRLMTAGTLDSIDRTISWSLRSDWDIVRRDWSMAVGEINDLLEDLTEHANPSLDLTPELARLTVSSTEEPDLLDHTIFQTRRRATMVLSVEVVSSTIPLVKLARILMKKLLEMIPKKPNFEAGTGINSETLEQFHDAFDSITGHLMGIMKSVRFVQWKTGASLGVDFRDDVLTSLSDLTKTLETASTNIALRLIPLLYGAEHASHASEFKAWSLTLEEAWDRILARLLVRVSSFEVRPEEQPQQENQRNQGIDT
ncbi:hypothetical protein Pst134EA_013884 [Puccinia striiformis f. sp. tritici]|uniref:hypothetical protein n=2 Tax=Puccinia striiformis f. sp. tritici TaxID=168172 RepID=UPI0020078EA8|nr:hypothetical protein Pst134EA_013884 [Puccinia striiformis f. sp. tritici]KAH9466035.1 hypothetical protein Pst134EA_013884 [Puccinia striiformis f. sp. tritici]